MVIEEALTNGASAAHVGNLLIGRCTSANTDRGDGASSPLYLKAARSLALGDREILFRWLYTLTVSPKVTAGLVCPTCGETIAFDLDLSISPEVPPEPGPVHKLAFEGRNATCRVLTGGDLEDAARSPDPFTTLRRASAGNCNVPADLLARELARLDPNAETAIRLACTNCGNETQVFLDGFELIRRALEADGGILRQVHRLASTYGWREADILATPRSRRPPLLRDDQRGDP